MTLVPRGKVKVTPDALPDENDTGLSKLTVIFEPLILVTVAVVGNGVIVDVLNEETGNVMLHTIPDPESIVQDTELLEFVELYEKDTPETVL